MVEWKEAVPGELLRRPPGAEPRAHPDHCERGQKECVHRNRSTCDEAGLIIETPGQIKEINILFGNPIRSPFLVRVRAAGPLEIGRFEPRGRNTGYSDHGKSCSSRPGDGRQRVSLHPNQRLAAAVHPRARAHADDLVDADSVLRVVLHIDRLRPRCPVRLLRAPSSGSRRIRVEL